MADFIGIADQFAKRFICAKDKKYALNMIMYDMNYLVYSENEEPLDYEAKSSIIRSIFNVIAGRRTVHLEDGQPCTANFSDIVIFFERRDFILKHLKAGIKQQCELN